MAAIDTALYAARRQRFMDAMGGGGALILTAPTRVRSRDTDHVFRPDSDFYWLTGFREHGAALLLLPDRAGGKDDPRTVAFVLPKDPHMETWHGRRLGVEAAPAALGVDAAHSIDELEQLLPRYLTGATKLHYTLGVWPDQDQLVLRVLPRLGSRHVLPPQAIVTADELLHEMRLRKDETERGLMRRAAAITAEGYRAAVAAIRPGAMEYEVQAALEGTYRRLGGDGPAYNSIVAAGENATILHYSENDMPLNDGELILIDSGAEFGYYACDVTRTYPINGRFTPAQRAVYDLVLKAQVEAIARVKVGEHVKAYHEHAVRVLTAGMVELGWLTGDVDELIKTEAFKRFYMHGTGHYLGLDTHDVGRYGVGGKDGASGHESTSGVNWRPLEPGMVVTVEPGLYVPHGAPGVDPAFWGIGIRIEDDVLVLEDGGHEVLTAAIPKGAEEIEALLSAAPALAR